MDAPRTGLGPASPPRSGPAASFEPVFVLGIDPGLTRCGYGAVVREGHRMRAVAAGVLTTSPALPLPERLLELRDGLRALIAEHRPEAVAVERVFFSANVRTAMSVGQASGLALTEAAAAGCVIAQYTPNEVKQAVAGWGAAPKEQVGRMVASLLGLSEPPRPADAADALALALCHLAGAPLRAALGRST